ncbi:fluoride efflux transporter CrcB [Mycobacterium sp. pV006]|uniref:fluoride efflux transporter CrcB n=1 Tax=Mycobacterium sp. pV006 TaxID=3238983 RepID=UPI00351B003E
MTATLVWAGVAVLGGLGAVTRWVVDGWVSRRASGPFPVGILAVNVTGALLLGAVAGLALPTQAALLAGTAFVGSYTTFSTWMAQTYELGEQRRGLLAAVNIVLSVALGLSAAFLGHWLATRW